MKLGGKKESVEKATFSKQYRFSSIEIPVSAGTLNTAIPFRKLTGRLN